MSEIPSQPKQEAYQVGIVRKLFLTGAIVMILTYPFFRPYLPESPAFITIAIVLLAVMAGLTNPKQLWTSGIDIVISLWAILFFESHAIMFVQTPFVGIFITDQVLVIIFLAATYFSVKNFRAMLNP